MNIEDVDYSKVPEDLKQNFRASLQQLSTHYMCNFLQVDIRELLPQIQCPVLALNGMRDTQVNFASNFSILHKGLICCKHELIAFEELNHLFQHCKTGLINEYMIIDETIAPEVLQKIIDWIRSTSI